jgi:hypothetical protein
VLGAGALAVPVGLALVLVPLVVSVLDEQPAATSPQASAAVARGAA